jgi:hypothetical protein
MAILVGEVVEAEKLAGRNAVVVPAVTAGWKGSKIPCSSPRPMAWRLVPRTRKPYDGPRHNFTVVRTGSFFMRRQPR